jgi:glutathionylspermidine synthase
MAKKDDVRTTVYTWFEDNLRGGALARATDAYNQVQTALPKLIEQLGGEPAQAPAADTGKQAAKAGPGA